MGFGGDYTDLVWKFTTECVKCMTIYNIWYNENIQRWSCDNEYIHIGLEIIENKLKQYVNLTVNGMCVYGMSCIQRLIIYIVITLV